MATKNQKRAAVGIAAGLAAAAAAGYYFYGSKNAKKHRGAAAKWANDMKKDVIRQARGLQNLTADEYAAVVEKVAATYRDAKNINREDLARAAQELISNWDKVKKELRIAGNKGKAKAKTASRRAGATVKKAVKRATKKTRSRARKSR